MSSQNVTIAAEGPLPLVASMLAAGGETLAARCIKDLALLPALSTLLVGGEANQLTCKHLIGDVDLLREAQRPVFLKFAERLLWHTKGLEDVVSI